MTTLTLRDLGFVAAASSSAAATVVTSGLVLNLDAGNPASYPGSGNAWFDTSGSGLNATLNNSPAYTSDSGGGLVFNGINHSGSFGASPALSTCTIEIVGKFTTTNDLMFLVGRENSYRVLLATSQMHWVVSTTNNGWYSNGTVVTPAPPAGALSTDCQIVCTYNGSALKVYMNGALIGTSSPNISGSIIALGNYIIGQSSAPGIALLKGTLRINRAYNRALSDAEVAQNFNAIRGRYGI